MALDACLGLGRHAAFDAVLFDLGKIVVNVLKGIDLEIATGHYISIMGPSGSGKSTLFNMIGGLDKPTSGKVFIDEVDIAQLDAYELAWLRCRKIGYILNGGIAVGMPVLLNKSMNSNNNVSENTIGLKNKPRLKNGYKKSLNPLYPLLSPVNRIALPQLRFQRPSCLLSLVFRPGYGVIMIK